MPARFWGEAVRHAVYLLNRLPTKALGDRTPFEAWMGRKPHLAHLRVFGCVAYVKNTTPHLKKLDDRSSPMVYLGVEEGCKAHRLFDPRHDKLQVSRDVVFQENSEWTWTAGANHEENLPEFMVEDALDTDEVIVVADIEAGTEDVPPPATALVPMTRASSPSTSSSSTHTTTSPDSHEGPVRFRSIADIYANTKEVVGIDEEENEVMLMMSEEPACYQEAATEACWSLVELGFKKCIQEHAVYTRGEGEASILVGVYVDDLIVIGGIEVEQQKSRISLRQSAYAKKILSQFKMADCNATKHPMEPKTQLHKDLEGTPVDATEYRRIVGCLRYLLHTRPDLSYSVGMVSRYMERPTIMHHRVVKQILSDLADDLDGRKSTSGMTFYFNESLVSWNSQKQKTVALSSCEAEFMAATTAACHALWLRSLASELTGVKPKPHATGIEAVVLYSPRIFKKAWLVTKDQLFLETIAVGTFKMAFILLAVMLVDRVRRRKLFLGSLTGMMASLVGLGTVLTVVERAEERVVWAEVLCVVFVLSFVSSFSCGLGPVTWVYASKIFPLRLRAQGASLGVAINRLMNSAMSMSFISLYKAISIGGAFFLFANIGVFAWAFYYTCCPETKGRALEEEMAEVFSRPDATSFSSPPIAEAGSTVDCIKGPNLHITRHPTAQPSVSSRAVNPSKELHLRLWKLRATLDLEADRHREEQIGRRKTRTRSGSCGGLGEDGEAQEQASVSPDMAGKRNNNNGELGGQNNQFLEGLTALLHEQNSIHGEQIQQILQAREQGSTPRCSTPSTQPVYKQFRELGPTEFKGTTDPITAEGWIRSLETIFDFMQLTDADKVRCTIFMLRDDARVWWEGARLTVDLTLLTWADFKEGDMTVAEYVRRFERGRYFVPMITSQPVEELKHFTEGLRPAIRHDVRLSRVTTFREAVDQALMSERDRNDMVKEAQNKRLSYQGRDQQEPGKKRSVPGQNPGKQSFKQAQSRQQIRVRAENKVRCSKCEKIHAGQCLTGTDACYMCKKSGHFARECPLLKEPTKGRVFAMTQEQVDLDTAIITGIKGPNLRITRHPTAQPSVSSRAVNPSEELHLRLWKLRATLDLEVDRHREEQIGRRKTRTRSGSCGGLGEDGEAQEQASVSPWNLVGFNLIWFCLYMLFPKVLELVANGISCGFGSLLIPICCVNFYLSSYYWVFELWINVEGDVLILSLFMCFTDELGILYRNGEDDFQDMLEGLWTE
ncbi:hypothetical protein ZIOFF_069701 [Zingiber officinale]|uniref:CCHC-type domain-containing protein n=1 Tax=Zingiber officinale TaxID=94328 RepID=A0A8J5CC25_ZINOF|nr:hypothetical protein ZIOFF_069701 [Zingiber officinale]